MKIRKWIKRHQGYFMIFLLLLIARGVQVVIFLYFDDMKDFFSSIFGFLGV